MHNTNASLYSQLGKYELAEYHLQRSSEKFIDNPSTKREYPSELITYYYNVISFHMLYEEYEKALEECDKAYHFY